MDGSKVSCDQKWKSGERWKERINETQTVNRITMEHREIHWNQHCTRIHSSRMRTVRCSGRLSRGGCLPIVGGVSWRVCVCLPRGGVHLHPVNRMTGGCKSITFPQLPLRTVKIISPGNLVKWTQYATVKFAWHFTGYFLSLILRCHQDKPLVTYVLWLPTRFRLLKLRRKNGSKWIRIYCLELSMQWAICSDVIHECS